MQDSYCDNLFAAVRGLEQSRHGVSLDDSKIMRLWAGHVFGIESSDTISATLLDLFVLRLTKGDCGNKVMDLIPVKDEQCRVNKCAENFDEACGDVGVLLLYSATNSTRHG